jgi:hypothetical protein
LDLNLEINVLRSTEDSAARKKPKMIRQKEGRSGQKILCFPSDAVHLNIYISRTKYQQLLTVKSVIISPNIDYYHAGSIE